jgi:hypothetical protein
MECRDPIEGVTLRAGRTAGACSSVAAVASATVAQRLVAAEA